MEIELIPALAALVEGGVWESRDGTSRAATWEVAFDDGRPSVFVKAARNRVATVAIDGEIARWGWLAARPGGLGLLPELLGHQSADADAGRPAALVTAGAVGVPELHWFVDPPVGAELFGRALREVHRLPVDACPFEAGPRAMLAAARERVEAGLVDPAGFHTAHQRYSPTELLHHAEALLPPEPDGDDLVVVHGDWSIGNLIARPDTGALTGVVDRADAGVGDRHFDLATAARSLVAHFGGECLPAFLAAYGWGSPTRSASSSTRWSTSSGDGT